MILFAVNVFTQKNINCLENLNLTRRVEKLPNGDNGENGRNTKITPSPYLPSGGVIPGRKVLTTSVWD